jgi:hypothetical protein
MAIPAAIYSLFMYLTGFAIIFYSKNLAVSGASPVENRKERLNKI